MDAETKKRAIAKARKKYEEGSNDDIEIDDNPKISDCDDGIWVAAWVWVKKEELQ